MTESDTSLANRQRSTCALDLAFDGADRSVTVEVNPYFAKLRQMTDTELAVELSEERVVKLSREKDEMLAMLKRCRDIIERMKVRIFPDSLSPEQPATPEGGQA